MAKTKQGITIWPSLTIEHHAKLMEILKERGIEGQAKSMTSLINEAVAFYLRHRNAPLSPPANDDVLGFDLD